MIDTLKKLKPVKIKESLNRAGNTNDGGYIIVTDLFKDSTILYSFGVGNEISFEEYAASKGYYACYMYDHTVDLSFKNPIYIFYKKGISSTIDHNMTTIRTELEKHNHTSYDNLLMQCDVEGAEWDIFANIDTQILKCFSQIVVEFHLEWGNTDCIIDAVNNLTEVFYPVHLHANNYAKLYNANGNPLPEVFEVTFARKDLVTVLPGDIFLPTALDSPNCPTKLEYLLGYFLDNKVGIQ